MRKNNFLKVGLVGLFSLMLTIGVNKGIEVKEVKAEDLVESFVISEIANQYGWNDAEVSGQAPGITQGVVTIVGSGTGHNCKYYAKNSSWRFYKTGSGKITISVEENFYLKEVKLTADGSVTMNSVSEGWTQNNSVYTTDLTDCTSVEISNPAATNQITKIDVTYCSTISEDAVLTGISLDDSTMPTEVYAGGQWDTSGIKVTATYDEGSTSDVTSQCTINFNPETVPSTIGMMVLTINASYKDKTASKTFNINVLNEPLIAEYKITTTSAVDTLGNPPENSSATFKNTYNTLYQMTKGHSSTLTLQGYDGYQIKNVTLSMKSNKSAGSGSINITAGSTTLYFLSATTFANFPGSTGYSSNFIDITPKIETKYTIQTGESVVIEVAATVNSLYLNSITVEYQDASSPIVTIESSVTEVDVNETIKLYASVLNAPDVTVVWSSENDKIATVTQDGIVTGISSGIAKITASITVNDVIYSDFVNITVLFAEPDPIDIEVADILNTEANNTVIYRVTGRISILGQYDDSTDPTKYGNIHIADFVDSSKSILVYGSTVTTSALKFDNKTGEYVFNNPQDFLTNSTTNSLVVGDVIEMLVFRLDFGTTKELNGVITKVYSDVDVLDKFVDRVMHTEVSYEEAGTGLCITEGWYDLAKQAYALLTDTQRVTFVSDEKYAQPYARLRAWASANGDTFDENNQIVSASNALNLVNNNNNIIIITVVTSALLLLAALVFIVMRKRKTN